MCVSYPSFVTVWTSFPHRKLCLHRQSTKKEHLSSYFLICNHFIFIYFFIAVANIFGMMYNHIKSGHCCPPVDLMGKHHFLLISMLRKFLYISSFLRTFIMNVYYILLNNFLHKSVRSYGFFSLDWIKLINFWTLFQAYIPIIKTLLIMMHCFIYIMLDIGC